MAGLKGYRKVVVALASILSATLAVGFGWIDGQQYVTTVLGTAGGFLMANVVSKKP
jgi:hypothetical protein